MDTTDSRYVVGWVMSGEIEVAATTPEQAIRKAKNRVRNLTKDAPVKVTTIKSEFAIPAAES